MRVTGTPAVALTLAVEVAIDGAHGVRECGVREVDAVAVVVGPVAPVAADALGGCGVALGCGAEPRHVGSDGGQQLGAGRHVEG